MKIRLLTTALLTCAAVVITGCGEQSAHLPASMAASSVHASGAGSGSWFDRVFGTDPGPAATGYRTPIDDPVLSDPTLNTIGDTSIGIGESDLWARASADWESSAGLVTAAMDDDDPWLNDDYYPVNYGPDWGYGSSVLGLGSASINDNSFVNTGFIDTDPFVDDGMFVGTGFDPVPDAGFADPGFDAGFVDAGFDPGFVDPGFDASFDPGFDPGFIDPGFDGGFADAGFDAGFDAGGFVY